MNDIEKFKDVLAASAIAILRQQYRDEIERAIANAKRSGQDRWFRREFYRAERGDAR